MSLSAKAFCARAMPYVKPALDDSAEATISLSFDDSPVDRALADGLLVLYLVDVGSDFEYVQHRHLKKAGLSVDQLHRVAMKNLRNFMAEKTRIQGNGDIFGLFLDGNFEASLLLVDELWDQSLAEYAPSGFVIVVPARDVLTFCDANSQEGISELREVISRVTPIGDHLISSDLYRRIDGKWERHPGT